MRVVIFQDNGNKVSAYTNRYIVEEDSHGEGTVYMLSAYAQTQAVNAILASIGLGGNIHLQVSGRTPVKLGEVIGQEFIDKNCIKAKRGWRKKSTFKSRAVSWGRAHGLYLDSTLNIREIDEDFIVWASTMEEVKDKIFSVLDAKPIPLLPEWKEYLLEVMEFERMIKPLTTYGCEAMKVVYKEPAILELIRDGIMSGSIVVPRNISEEENLLRAA